MGAGLEGQTDVVEGEEREEGAQQPLGGAGGPVMGQRLTTPPARRRGTWGTGEGRAVETAMILTATTSGLCLFLLSNFPKCGPVTSQLRPGFQIRRLTPAS